MSVGLQDFEEYIWNAILLKPSFVFVYSDSHDILSQGMTDWLNIPTGAMSF